MEKNNNIKNNTIKIGALFVDLENVYFALTTAPFHLLGDEALNAVLDIVTEVRNKVSESANLIVERCYADFDQLPPSTQRQFQIAGILPRYVDARKGKSSADIELSLDLLEALYRRSEIEIFVLVGGDRDYLPILRRLKESYKYIIVWALSSGLSADVQEFIRTNKCGEINHLDNLVKIEDYRTKAEIVVDKPESVASTASSTPTMNFSPKEPRLKPPPGPLETYNPHEDYDWELRYLDALFVFMRENDYDEVHLGPFFRWLNDHNIMELISTNDKRRVFQRLQRMGVVQVEERDSGGGFSWSALKINYNHPLTKRYIQQGGGG
ncbi:MAG: NYN domain-containing protein [Myxococcota bacterium]